MAVLLYKPGATAVVRGVACDFVRVALAEIPEYEKMGWSRHLPQAETQEPESEPVDYLTLTVRELQKAASLRGVTNVRKLSKAALIEVLSEED